MKHAPMSILLVEDQSLIALTIEDALLDAGHRVIYSSDGARAFERFVADPFGVDLIVADIGLPGMNGIVLKDECRKIRPNLPVIVTSGFPIKPGLHTDQPVTRFLDKPFTIESLTALVDEIAASR
jgi:DNA-binding NtrC family response regulator